MYYYLASPSSFLFFCCSAAQANLLRLPPLTACNADRTVAALVKTSPEERKAIFKSSIDPQCLAFCSTAHMEVGNCLYNYFYSPSLTRYYVPSIILCVIFYVVSTVRVHCKRQKLVGVGLRDSWGAIILIPEKTIVKKTRARAGC